MCGIVGLVDFSDKGIDISNAIEMTDILSHRGPDDAGYLFYYFDKNNPNFSYYLNVTSEKYKAFNPFLPSLENDLVKKELSLYKWNLFIGHRRLSIIDLTYFGHQPMSDISKNIWISYNGEIYNFKELKQELIQLGYRFLSNSDTEVIIYSYIEWGIDFVRRLNGMFAFVIYDNLKKKILLVRDRYGIKPLYYYLDRNNLIFASEIKSILKFKGYKLDFDYIALLEYFTFQNIFSDRTFFKDVKLLNPGYILDFDLVNQKAYFYKYYDYNIFDIKINDIVDSVNEMSILLSKSVYNQLISDVEIGSYLSGGIDTSLIVYFASKYIKDLKTFTVGFDMNNVSGVEIGIDERKYSEYYSYIFGTEHYEMVLKSGDLERCIKSLVWAVEEPRVGQTYPNFYASKLASKFVKVVLSGIGADELFGGYIWRYFYQPVSNFQDFINKYYLYWNRLVPNSVLKKLLSPISKEIEGIWTIDIFADVFKDIKDNFSDDLSVYFCFYLELKTFLHGLLVVEDKISMSHSLETRVPFLDNDLVNYSLLIDYKLKIDPNFIIKISENDLNKLLYKKTNTNKIVLREVAKKVFPKELLDFTELPKQGFSAPDSSWFRGQSINYLKSIVNNKNNLIFELLDQSVVMDLFNEHLERKANRRLFLWSLIYFHEFVNIFFNNHIWKLINSLQK